VNGHPGHAGSLLPSSRFGVEGRSELAWSVTDGDVVDGFEQFLQISREAFWLQSD
jgi:hypothetical protein